MEKRINFIDIARGIAIISVVAGHTFIGDIKQFIFSFHMPLFILVSGYFFNNNCFDNLKNITVYIKKMFLPYFISCLGVNILDWFRNSSYQLIPMIKDFIKKIVFSVHHMGITLYPNVSGVVVLWFIPMLIMVQIIYYILRKLYKNDIILGIIIVLFSIIGFLLAKINLFLPWSLDVSLVCLSFFYIGNMVRKYNLLSKLFENNFYIIFIFVIWILAVKYIGSIDLAFRIYPKYFLCFIPAIFGSYFILFVSKFIDKKETVFSKFLMWCGKNSLLIMIFHNFELLFINYKYFGINNLYLLFAIKISIVCIASYILKLITNEISKLYCKKIKNIL